MACVFKPSGKDPQETLQDYKIRAAGALEGIMSTSSTIQTLVQRAQGISPTAMFWASSILGFGARKVFIGDGCWEGPPCLSCAPSG